MPAKKTTVIEPMEPLLVELRGQRVILDWDLARIYEVETKRFNETCKRNRDRFPSDFVFQLTASEWKTLRSQAARTKAQGTQDEHVASNWSQIATSPGKNRGAAYRPWAFTEHGALMAANVLRSPRAVQMSVYVVRAFIRQRAQLAEDANLLKRLAAIDEKLLAHDGTIIGILDLVKALMGPVRPLPPPPLPKPRIGFHS